MFSSLTAHFRRTLLALAAFLWALLAPALLFAGGPKFVAGVTYFNSGVLGQPAHWSGGQLNYYVDPGPLNASINNQQAVAMVDAAAALWSAVPTAGVTLTDKGPLNEIVSTSNLVISSAGVITQPADLTPSATNYPVGVIFDADGSITDAIYGTGASSPTSCQYNGVRFWIDNFNPDATIAHAIILVNGLCASNANMIEMIDFEIERAFGRILGLDYAQVNPLAITDDIAGGTQGWPVMQPISGVCGATGGQCIPNYNVLRYDDIAALNRIYPITAANLSSFPGKQITAANSVSIQGTITFATGIGMQGVNVVARPLDSSGNPLYQYTVTFVSGAYFNGNHGNPVTGWTDSSGNLLTNWGSDNATLQGFFDLSGIPLPPGVTTANYQLTFETINALYIDDNSVGPYIDGSPAPSGTLSTISVPSMSAGSTQTLAISIDNSALGGGPDSIGTETQPRTLPSSGMWCGRLSQVGQSDWFNFPVRGNRTFTVVTEAINESGTPTDLKAMPAIGVWDAFDAAGSSAVGAAPGLNGLAAGESWLRVSASADDLVRIAITDQRGDGRPDYAYNGWLLYADTISPQRLPASGGAFVIEGSGFRITDTVSIGGQQALLTSISPTEITGIAPPAASGVTGSVNVEVDDLPIYYAVAIITDGISYDAGNGDSLTLVTAPSGAIPVGVPTPFTVTALGSNLSPASGVTVTYSVSSGTATLGCGSSTCSVTATGDGRASIAVTAADSNPSIVFAKLTNGASLESEFTGGTPPQLAAISPKLSVAAGVTFTWTVEALTLSGGAPLANQTVYWSSSTGIGLQAASSISNSSGIATMTLSIGPLTEGQQTTATACLSGNSSCVTYTVLGARPEYAQLEAVSGTAQTLAVSATPGQIVLRLLDMNGNPMAGGLVSISQSVYAYAPPCPVHGRCDAAELLATQPGTAISALDGTVIFTPATIPGVATNLIGLAASGNSATLSISIQQYP